MNILIKELNRVISELKQIPKIKSVVYDLEKISESIQERYVGEKVSGIVEDLKFIVKKNTEKIEDCNKGFNNYVNGLIVDLKKDGANKESDHGEPEGIITVLKMIGSYNDKSFKKQLVSYNKDLKTMYTEINELGNENYKDFLMKDVIANCNKKINDSLDFYEKEFEKWIDWEIDRNKEMMKKGVHYNKDDVKVFCENLENAKDIHNKMSETIIGTKWSIDELNYFMAHKDDLNQRIENKKENKKENKEK